MSCILIVSSFIVFSGCADNQRPTQGLEFNWIPSQRAKEVSVGTATNSSRIVIPEFYNNILVTRIADNGFSNLDRLTSIVLPARLNHIGQRAFYGSANLQGITIPIHTSFGQNTMVIGKDAFKNSGIWLSTAYNSVVYADNWVVGYRGTLDSNIILRENTIGIATRAFANNNDIVNLTIPASVTYVAEYAFKNCLNLSITWYYNPRFSSFRFYEYLAHVIIPNNIHRIERRAFYNARNLKTVIFEENSILTDIDPLSFENATALTSIVIPNSVTNIAGAFRGAYNLASVIFEENSQLYGIWERTFYGAIALENIILPPSVGTIVSNAFYNTGIWNNAPNDSVIYIDRWAIGVNGEIIGELAIRPDTIGIAINAFSNQSQITSVVIPYGLDTIPMSAFRSNTNLQSVTLPNSITRIGLSAFSRNYSLKNIIIPSSVTHIDGHAFQFSNLTSIVLHSNIYRIGSHTFNLCYYLTIFAEPTSRPDGWHTQGIVNFNMSNRPIVWGVNLSDCSTFVVSFTRTANNIQNYAAKNGMSAPFRQGYVFGGWSTTQGGTLASFTAQNVYNAPNGTTLYAIWKVV